LMIGHHFSSRPDPLKFIGLPLMVSCEGSVTSMQRGEIIDGGRSGDIAIPRSDLRAAVI
jgi:hypothetical protein